MRYPKALLLSLMLTMGGCVFLPPNDEPKSPFPASADLLYSADLAWSADTLCRYNLPGDAMRDIPRLLPISSRGDMTYSLLRGAYQGVRPDGLPLLQAPEGYTLLVWYDQSARPWEPRYVGWTQVFAYPNDWRQRAARGMNSRDIAWAFYRRTPDMSGWEEVSDIFPCVTRRYLTPEEREIESRRALQASMSWMHYQPMTRWPDPPHHHH